MAGTKGHQKLKKSKMTPEGFESSMLRLTQARDIVTELARYIAVVEKDPVRREDLYFKLIESLDFSADWTHAASSKKLGELYKDLAYGWWGDLPDQKKSTFWSDDDEEEEL